MYWLINCSQTLIIGNIMLFEAEHTISWRRCGCMASVIDPHIKYEPDIRFNFRYTLNLFTNTVKMYNMHSLYGPKKLLKKH